MLINPQVTSKNYFSAALAIDQALQNMEDLERLDRMRRLGGGHCPPGGPPHSYTNETLTYLAEGLAGALELIQAHEEQLNLLLKRDEARGKRVAKLEKALADEGKATASPKRPSKS